MKTKKTLLAVLTAVLVMALIISCANPFENENPNGNNEQLPVPEGRTLVRLSFGNSNARTIYPDTSAFVDPEDFGNFILKVVNTSDNATETLATPFDDYCVYTDFDVGGSGVFDLTSGKNYTFTIYAFVDDSETFDLDDPLSCKPIAMGSKSVTNLSTSNAGIVIELNEIINGTNTGTFAWDVDVATNDYATASLTLATVAAPGTAVRTIDLVANSTDSDPTIPSGYYRMVITLTKAKHQTVYVRETIHIYAGLTTTYDATLPALRSNWHQVDFDYDGATTDGPTDTEAEHGTTIAVAYATEKGDSDPPENTGDTTKVFGGWYYDSGYTKPAAGTALILQPVTLYAKWIPADTTINFTISLNWTGGGTPPVVTGSGSYTYATLGDPNSGTLTLSASITGITSSSYVWYADHELSTSIGSGATLTITDMPVNSTNAPWFLSGGFTIYVNTDTGTYEVSVSPTVTP